MQRYKTSSGLAVFLDMHVYGCIYASKYALIHMYVFSA